MAAADCLSPIWQLKKCYDARLPDNVGLVDFPINVLDLQDLLVSDLIIPEQKLERSFKALEDDEGPEIVLGAVNWRRAFWKRLVRQLEIQVKMKLDADSQAEVEVADSILLYYTHLLSAGDSCSVTSLRRFHFDLDHTERSVLTIEDNAAISEGTTGLRTWPAALHLANHIIVQTDLLLGKKVLELGCGAGLLSLLVYKLQQQRCTGGSIVATDLHEAVLDRVRWNAVINNAKALAVEQLDWSSSHNFLEGISFDTILAADVVYDPEVAPLLASCLAHLLQRSSGCEALICLTIRNMDTFETFSRACGHNKLDVCETALRTPPTNLSMCADALASHDIRLFRIVTAANA